MLADENILNWEKRKKLKIKVGVVEIETLLCAWMV